MMYDCLVRFLNLWLNTFCFYSTVFVLKYTSLLQQHVLYFVKVVENETRSDPPDESPLLLSAAAGVSHKYVYAFSGPCHKAAF